MKISYFFCYCNFYLLFPFLRRKKKFFFLFLTIVSKCCCKLSIFYLCNELFGFRIVFFFLALGLVWFKRKVTSCERRKKNGNQKKVLGFFLSFFFVFIISFLKIGFYLFMSVLFFFSLCSLKRQYRSEGWCNWM